MSKAFGSIFGKDPQPVQQPTGFQTLPRFAQEAFEESVTRGRELAQQPELFAPAPLTGQQQAALGALEAGLTPFSAQQFQQGLQTFQDPFEEQVVQSALADLQRTGRGALSDIGAGAAGAGAFGGTRQALLESQLASDLARQAGALSGQLRSQGFQQAASRTLENLARPQQVAQALFPLADVQRQIQFGQQQAPLDAVRFLSGLAQGVPVGGGQTTFSPGGGGILAPLGQFAGGVGGLLQGIQGGGGAASGLASTFGFSDKNLKTNIELVDNKDGINIYEYAYKWDPSKRWRGVIAQEVEKVRPDAVTTVNGYLGVNYAKLGFAMEAV